MKEKKKRKACSSTSRSPSKSKPAQCQTDFVKETKNIVNYTYLPPAKLMSSKCQTDPIIGEPTKEGDAICSTQLTSTQCQVNLNEERKRNVACSTAPPSIRTSKSQTEIKKKKNAICSTWPPLLKKKTVFCQTDQINAYFSSITSLINPKSIQSQTDFINPNDTKEIDNLTKGSSVDLEIAQVQKGRRKGQRLKNGGVKTSSQQNMPIGSQDNLTMDSGSSCEISMTDQQLDSVNYEKMSTRPPCCSNWPTPPNPFFCQCQDPTTNSCQAETYQKPSQQTNSLNKSDIQEASCSSLPNSPQTDPLDGNVQEETTRTVAWPPLKMMRIFSLRGFSGKLQRFYCRCKKKLQIL